MIAASALAIAAAGVDLGTWHEHPGYNNVNPGAYVVVQVADHNIGAGVYRNSERGNSAWVGWRSESAPVLVLGLPVRAAVTLGAVTGYKRAAVSPLVLGSIGVEVSPGWTVWMSGFPRPTPKEGSAGVHFHFERRFK